MQQDHIEVEYDHVHHWTDSKALPLPMYPGVFPHVCVCGAVKKFDGTVLPARLS